MTKPLTEEQIRKLLALYEYNLSGKTGITLSPTARTLYLLKIETLQKVLGELEDMDVSAVRLATEPACSTCNGTGCIPPRGDVCYDCHEACPVCSPGKNTFTANRSYGESRCKNCDGYGVVKINPPKKLKEQLEKAGAKA